MRVIRWVPNVAVFAACFAFVFLTSGIALTLVGQTGETDDGSLDRFKNFAEGLFDFHDKNNDGFLSGSEMKTISPAFSEKRFDKNGDNQLSFEELVDAIRRPTSAQVENAARSPESSDLSSRLTDSSASQPGTQTESALTNELGNLNPSKSDQPDQEQPRPTTEEEFSGLFEVGSHTEVREFLQRFLAQSMLKNDKDRNGQLDPDEIEQAQWSSPKWQDSDTNHDGILTRNEMQVRYQTMLVKRLMDQDKERKRNLELQRIDRASRSREESALIQSLGGGRRGRQLALGMAGQATGGRNGRDADRDREASPRLLVDFNSRQDKQEPTGQQDTPVAFDFFLLQLKSDSTGAARDGALDKIRTSSAQKLGQTIAKFATEFSQPGFDQLKFTALDGERSELSSGASIPIKTSVSQQSGGRRTYNVQYQDVGLKLKVTPNLKSDSILLSVDLEKSDVVELKEEPEATPNQKMVSLNYKSSLNVADGQPELVLLNSSGQQWLLVFQAQRIGDEKK